MRLRMEPQGLPRLLVQRLLVLVMQLQLLVWLPLLPPPLLLLLPLLPNLFLVPRFFPFKSSREGSDESPFLDILKPFITNDSKSLATWFSLVSGAAFLDIDLTFDGRKAHRNKTERTVEKCKRLIDTELSRR